MTKAEKREIGRHSAPRWELDVVGYRASDNTLLVVECKSYLDSIGVRADAFDGSNEKHAKRYKLFNEPVLREVILNRLSVQFTESGACSPSPTVRLALACGRIRNQSDRIVLRSRFEQNGWELWDEEWLRKHLRQMATQGYENQTSAVVAKLLLRGKLD